MIIKKESRHAVYKYLYGEGVLFAEKDPNLAQHPAIPEVSNLEVMKLMQSFVSKKYVKELFAWRHFYWFLTNEGITYLREYLNLPDVIVPKTLRKEKRTPTDKRVPGGRDRGRYGDDRGGREGYRTGFGRGGGGGDKGYGSTPGQYQPQFAGADSGDRWDVNKG